MEHLLQIDFQTSLACGVKSAYKMWAKFYSQIVCLSIVSSPLPWRSPPETKHFWLLITNSLAVQYSNWLESQCSTLTVTVPVVYCTIAVCTVYQCTIGCSGLHIVLHCVVFVALLFVEQLSNGHLYARPSSQHPWQVSALSSTTFSTMNSICFEWIPSALVSYILQILERWSTSVYSDDYFG